MILWVYAVGERSAAAAVDGEGVDSAPVRAVPAADLMAVVSEHPAEPERTGRAMVEHASVVDRVAARGAVLPARFGTVVRDGDALRAALAARRGDLVRNLSAVRGRVELAVRALPARAERRQHEPASGRDYLLVRSDTDRAARDVDSALGSFAVRSRRLVPRNGEALRASYLVEREDVAAFFSAVERLNARPGPAVLCTGPWPPYSFADAAPAG